MGQRFTHLQHKWQQVCLCAGVPEGPAGGCQDVPGCVQHPLERCPGITAQLRLIALHLRNTACHSLATPIAQQSCCSMPHECQVWCQGRRTPKCACLYT